MLPRLVRIDQNWHHATFQLIFIIWSHTRPFTFTGKLFTPCRWELYFWSMDSNSLCVRTRPSVRAHQRLWRCKWRHRSERNRWKRSTTSFFHPPASSPDNGRKSKRGLAFYLLCWCVRRDYLPSKPQDWKEKAQSSEASGVSLSIFIADLK